MTVPEIPKKGLQRINLKRGSKDLKPLRRKQLKSNYLVTIMLSKCPVLCLVEYLTGLAGRKDNGSLRLHRDQKAK
jgi:hypothetical protein